MMLTATRRAGETSPAGCATRSVTIKTNQPSWHLMALHSGLACGEASEPQDLEPSHLKSSQE
jgi:hypothetical protein